jgi:hypothetical protein
VLRVGSLCTGYGGLEMGLRLAGVESMVAWVAETAPELDVLYGPTPNHGDVGRVDWSSVAPIDILTAGFPCQPVSAAGRQRGDADERWLWPAVWAGIAELQPPQVFIENVRNLISTQDGRLWTGILDNLAELGYGVRWLTLGACHVGAAHHRHRVFALATMGGAGVERVPMSFCGAKGGVVLPTPGGVAHVPARGSRHGQARPGAGPAGHRQRGVPAAGGRGVGVAVLTWGGVHVGDTVRGADGGVWVVVGRAPAATWVGAGGETAGFALQCGARRVDIERKHNDPAPVISAADHRAMAAAAAVLYDAFPETEFISEVLETDVPPRKRAAAAAAPTVTEPAQAAHAYLSGTTNEYVPGALSAETPTPDGGTGGGVLLTGASAPASPVRDPFLSPLTPTRGDAPMGRWGWYELPHPITGEPKALFPRVSTISKTLADTYGLEQWKLRMVAKGVGMRPDLQAKAAALDPDVDKKDFADVVETAMQAAESGRGANFGTAMHKFAERLDDGESVKSMGVPPALMADVEAYARVLREAHLTVVPEYSERVCVNPEYNYAGRWDRVVRDREGNLFILDLKTGKDVLEYGSLEYATQQALYAYATHLCTPDFTGYEAMPRVDTDKALILHLPIGTGTGVVYGIDLIKGWRCARMSFEVRATRADARSGWMWAYAPASPEAAVQLRIGRAKSLDELMTATADAKRIGAWNDAMEAYALGRYDVIRAYTAPDKAALAALWNELYPAGRWTEEVAGIAAERATEVDNLVNA